MPLRAEAEKTPQVTVAVASKSRNLERTPFYNQAQGPFYLYKIIPMPPHAADATDEKTRVQVCDPEKRRTHAFLSAGGQVAIGRHHGKPTESGGSRQMRSPLVSNFLHF